MKGHPAQPIQYQDAEKRARKHHSQTEGVNIHEFSTLAQFMLKCDDPNFCRNRLDSPNTRPETPWFISAIANDSRAFEMTRTISNARLPLCVNYNARRRILKDNIVTQSHRCLCEAVKRLNLDRTKTSAELFQKAEEEFENRAQGHPPTLSYRPDIRVEQTFDDVDNLSAENRQGHKYQPFSGIQTMSWDMSRSPAWVIITGSGFFTDNHHDAGGYASWMTMRFGVKIWGIIRPKIRDDETDRAGVINAQLRALSTVPDESSHEEADHFNIFLMQGDVLIIPPNAIHRVYTPVHSIGQGGHILPYDSLHLTELSRLFNKTWSGTATNADHAGIFQTLCRMVIALPYIASSITFRRRPFLALSVMILSPENYEPREEVEIPRPMLAKYNLHRVEVKEDGKMAQDIIKKIYKHHKLTLAKVVEELDVGGDNWDKAGSATIDLTCVMGEI